jgi:hypothetical protein
MPRFAQRAHVGFSLLHLSLEAAHRLQLSRSLGQLGVEIERAEECNVSIDKSKKFRMKKNIAKVGYGRWRYCLVNKQASPSYFADPA